MPYNTRRKSLSLPSLGIHVPVSHAARDAARAQRAVAADKAQRVASSDRYPSPSLSASSASSVASASAPDEQPSKRVKRSHSDVSHLARSRPRSTSSIPVVTIETPAGLVRRANTPPPSPPPPGRLQIDGLPDAAAVDLTHVKDEIVEAVMVQLQHTANRPHIVKDLATVLIQQLRVVQQSANPCAIISSRLSSYLKRPCWSSEPCPLAKELETVHPRRTYFYLTTCPRQPLPDPALTLVAARRSLATPSISSANSTSEDLDMDRRRDLSPSPEIDLFSPDLDDVDEDGVGSPSSPTGSFPSAFPSLHQPVRPDRGASPALETDEKEFTQTADGLQKRKLSGDLWALEPESGMDLDDGTRDDNAGLFFEPPNRQLTVTPAPFTATSPAMRPSLPEKKDSDGGWAKVLGWDRSLENVELAELDCLLEDL